MNKCRILVGGIPLAMVPMFATASTGQEQMSDLIRVIDPFQIRVDTPRMVRSQIDDKLEFRLNYIF